MDYLFIELMLWGRQAGYRWFNLGMAPLSGLEAHPLAPAWHRVGNSSSATASTSITSKGCGANKGEVRTDLGTALPEWRVGASRLPRGGRCVGADRRWHEGVVRQMIVPSPVGARRADPARYLPHPRRFALLRAERRAPPIRRRHDHLANNSFMPPAISTDTSTSTL